MFLLQRVRSAIVPSRVVDPQVAARAFGAIAVLAIAQALAGQLWAQDHDGKNKSWATAGG
jgi:hypothetical protein